MKILICTTVSLEDSSAARNRLLRMCRALALQRISTILVGSGTGLETSWQESCVEGEKAILYDPNRISVKRYCRAMTFGATAANFYSTYLPSILEQYQCDGIINYAYQAQTAIAILNGARSTGAFVVADMVERFDVSLYRVLNGMNYQQSMMCNRVLPKMDGVIGISRGWCNWADRRGLPNVWIPSFAEEHANVRTAPPQVNRIFNILFIGHWVDRELPCVILKSILKCVDNGVNVQLRVLGKVGHLSRERKAMRFLRGNKVLLDHVEFLGFVSDAERDCELANADAFILLRRECQETEMLFPTRLPEYLLTGNPVILTAVDNFTHCFKHKEDVYFISKKNRVTELADAISHIAKNPNERQALGARGRQAAKREFSLELLGSRLAEFLKQVAV